MLSHRATPVYPV